MQARVTRMINGRIVEIVEFPIEYTKGGKFKSETQCWLAHIFNRLAMYRFGKGAKAVFTVTKFSEFSELKNE